MVSESPPRSRLRDSIADIALALVAVAVVAFYFARVSPAESELGHREPRDAYYNRLVDGFRAGHLHLDLPVPEGLTRLADPYDPSQSQPFRGNIFDAGRLHDTTYYRGEIYLYFGITPALLLFWPYRALTGGYLSHQHAVALFCAVGFVASAGLLRAAARRYFPAAGPALLAGGALALGLATSVPVMLLRPDVWEVPIACGYALVMLTLLALWRAWHAPDRGLRWLAVASALYGLAVGARPSLLLGAPLLLLPLLSAFRRDAPARPALPRLLRELAAVLGPIALIGAGLALYNHQRFGSIFEFGQTYQLADDRQDTVEHFSARYFWFNVRLYFFQTVRWSEYFPFVFDPPDPPMPEGHGGIDRPNGLLLHTPVTVLALLLPWAWWRLAGAAHAPFRGALLAVAMLFLAPALTLCHFYGTCVRYQVEFQPALVLLAVLLALAWHRSADTPARRIAFLILWPALLSFSAAFSVIKDYHLPARTDALRAMTLLSNGQPAAAIPYYERAIARNPRLLSARGQLGIALQQLGRLPEAVRVFEAALAIVPNHPELHVDLGGVLWQLHRQTEAILHFRHALGVDPDFADGHFALSNALRALGQADEARFHYDEARRRRPELPPARF